MNGSQKSVPPLKTPSSPNISSTCSCWSYGVKAPQVMWIEFWYQTHKSHHRIFLSNHQKKSQTHAAALWRSFFSNYGNGKFFSTISSFHYWKNMESIADARCCVSTFFFKFLLDDIPCGSKLCSEKAPKKLRQKTYWIPMCPPLKFSILSSCWLPHKDGTFGGPHHCHD